MSLFFELIRECGKSEWESSHNAEMCRFQRCRRKPPEIRFLAGWRIRVHPPEIPLQSLGTGNASSPKSICFLRDYGAPQNHHLHDIFVLINPPCREGQRGKWLTINPQSWALGRITQNLSFSGHTNLCGCSQIQGVSSPRGCGCRSAWHRPAECAFPRGEEAERSSWAGRQPKRKAIKRASCKFICLGVFSITFPKRTKMEQVHLVVWIEKDEMDYSTK